MQTFFHDEDYKAYIELMSEWCNKHKVEVWAYCLMPNHVHMIAVPETEDGLRRAIGEAHRRYTRLINFREGWRGHLWQGRFASYPMEENYLLTAASYIELNPVRAKLVSDPFAWRWSSASSHLNGQDDGFIKTSPLLGMISDWREFLMGSIEEEELEKLRRHERTGRPLGNVDFVENLENRLERILKMKKPGRKGNISEIN